MRGPWAAAASIAVGVGLAELAACAAAPEPSLELGAPPSRAPRATSTALPRARPAPESAAELRYRLLEEQDTDCDQRITARDDGSRRFRFELDDQTYELGGLAVLSNLEAELAESARSGRPVAIDRALEDPIARTARLIRDEHWGRLTHTLDEAGLPRLLEHPRLAGDAHRLLYVPEADPAALVYFQRLRRRYDTAYVRLEQALGGLPFVELTRAVGQQEKQRILLALLRTEDGRATLREVTRRFAAQSRDLDYPALSRQLAAGLERVDAWLALAPRPCVQASTARTSRMAAQIARELEQFAPKRLFVRALPPPPDSSAWLAAPDQRHGLLSLALRQEGAARPAGVPFVAGDERAPELPGWESYLIMLGLLGDGAVELARGLVDNALYSAEHYGAHLAANHSHYLGRAQPPLLPAMVRAVWQATPAEQRDPAWLARGLRAALEQYRNVWANDERRFLALCRGSGEERTCLAHHAGAGSGEPPEAEPGQFAGLWRDLGRSLEASYVAGTLSRRDLTAELDRAFRHERCVRESGHGETYRWFWATDDGAGGSTFANRCADIAPVDLNSVLHAYEVDVAWLAQAYASYRDTASEMAEVPRPARDPRLWCARARHRLELMKAYLWSPGDGLFYDAFVPPEAPSASRTSTGAAAVHTRYVSAATLYPLWATRDGCGSELHDGWLSPNEKSALVTNALLELEAPGGLLASARSSRERHPRGADTAGDYPYGRAPHQMLAWAALERHGFHEDAERLASSWLYTLLSALIDEAYAMPPYLDVVRRALPPAESLETRLPASGISPRPHTDATMIASFQVGLARSSPGARRRLERALAQR